MILGGRLPPREFNYSVERDLNTASVGEKIAVNFEGCVSVVENEKVVLEDGKIIIIDSDTAITTSDGSFQSRKKS